ncbi:hypothetical protein [Solidesulfovibrio sp.]|uniref:hypothetical protein n=1 Tax=Solidesulfovibrio sp. TaxID=2910990 RepID=UPI00262B9AF7|nr:hypothetical protein [Solidesulfovibrio sp.]
MDTKTENYDILVDNRTGCLSIICTTTVNSYLRFIHKSYLNKGDIEKQREPLNTKTAIRIRQIMIDDIIKGAILPPIVIGIVVSDEKFKMISNGEVNITKDIDSESVNTISIIDGIQRTTALILALTENSDIQNHSIRIEYWISKSINSLIYRMLVLNTGQIPWDLRRQLETIYKALINEINSKVKNIELLSIEDKARRRRPGVFQANKIIEMFLSFTSRKNNVDLKEKVASDFARMDAIEALANESYILSFTTVLQYLVNIDFLFSSYSKPDKEDSMRGKFSDGLDIFTSQPASIGFIVASAVYIYGRPGIKHNDNEITVKGKLYQEGLLKLQGKLAELNPNDMRIFLDFPGLNEKIAIRTGKVGDFERDFFTKAFGTLIELGTEIDSMAPCWEAYY